MIKKIKKSLTRSKILTRENYSLQYFVVNPELLICSTVCGEKIFAPVFRCFSPCSQRPILSILDVFIEFALIFLLFYVRLMFNIIIDLYI